MATSLRTRSERGRADNYARNSTRRAHGHGAARVDSRHPERRQSPDRPAEPGNWSTRKKAALALGVGAAGAAAAGTVFYLLYRSRSNDFNHSTDHAGARCTIADPVDNCKTLNDDINRAQILAVVGFAGAGVLLGVGSYLVLTDQPRDHGGIAVGDGKLSFRCLPSVGAALTCAGTF